MLKKEQLCQYTRKSYYSDVEFETRDQPFSKWKKQEHQDQLTANLYVAMGKLIAMKKKHFYGCCCS